MKNYKVEVVFEFDDIEEKEHRKKGDMFYCTKQRYEFLKSKNAVTLVGIVAKEIPVDNVDNSVDKQKKKATTRKTTKKKE